MNTPYLDGIRKEAGIPWHQMARPWVLPTVGGVLGAGAGAAIDEKNRLRGGAIGAGAGALAGLGGMKILRGTKKGQSTVRKAMELAEQRAAMNNLKIRGENQRNLRKWLKEDLKGRPIPDKMSKADFSEWLKGALSRIKA